MSYILDALKKSDEQRQSDGPYKPKKMEGMDLMLVSSVEGAVALALQPAMSKNRQARGGN